MPEPNALTQRKEARHVLARDSPLCRAMAFGRSSLLLGSFAVFVLAVSCSESSAPTAPGTETGGGTRAPEGSGAPGSPAGAPPNDVAPQAGAPISLAGEPSTAGKAAGGEASGGEDAGSGGDAVPGYGGAQGGTAEHNGGGQGGAMVDAPRAGETCVACGAEQCASAVDSCKTNPECAAWLSCLAACDDSACASACDASHAGLSRVYYGVYECLCSSCDAACGLARSCEKKCSTEGALPVTSSPPATLLETGLYSADGSVAPAVYPYQVRFPLWADAASKERYIYLPPCAKIDTKDMDHWQFPVGTRLWKHFSVDGALVETRLIHRYGAGASDWLFASYGWDPARPGDPSAALFVPHGKPSANGTLHDIPDPSACFSCHDKLPDKPLGFSAVQLSHSAQGLNMQRLSDWGWLSVPARQGFSVPGNAVQQAALGYLHGNCGGCHNSFGEIPRENPMKLRLLVAQTDYAHTDTVLTTVGVPTINAYPELHGKPRIHPQARADSTVLLRMSDRNKFPMPPLASKFPDSDGGVAAVAAWIDSLPAP